MSDGYFLLKLAHVLGVSPEDLERQRRDVLEWRADVNAKYGAQTQPAETAEE